MSHTYHSLLVHVVFATKDRIRTLTPEIRARLFPLIGGIAREKGMTALCVGGVEDHVHVLLRLPSTMDVARAVQLIKGESSGWVAKEFPQATFSGWQEGYGAFSISVSQIEVTVRYIEQQEEHHRRKTFEEEFVQFLKRNQLELPGGRGFA